MLNTGENREHLNLANVKAKEIVKDEISAYLSDNGYGDLKHFYREAMAGRAQENMNHLCHIESFIKRETDSAKVACDFFSRGERLSFCDYLHASTLSCFYIAWILYNDCDSAISFSELLSPYSSFQDALEGIAAREGKTPEEVEAGLRRRFPLAFERQE